jgi:hypothetical protein
MSDSVFQIFAIDENLKQCHFQLGNLVKFIYQGEVKLVMMTFLDNLSDIYEAKHHLHFYCTNNKNNHFLNFFEGLLKFDSDSLKKDYFLIGQRFGLINLEINYLFLNLVKTSGFCLNKFFMLFEVPFNMLELLDYNSIPTINLDEEKKIEEQQNIFFFSMPLNYKKDLEGSENEIKNYYLENLIKYDKLSLNFGQTKRKCKEEENLYTFDSCSEYGSVGSLVFSQGDVIRPVGVNAGASKDGNVYNSITEKNILEFLKNYMLLSLDNIVFTQ